MSLLTILVLAADVPIWAGIGLIVVAAVAGNALARRRNRRRLERYESERRD